MCGEDNFYCYFNLEDIKSANFIVNDLVDNILGNGTFLTCYLCYISELHVQKTLFIRELLLKNII